VYYINFGPHGPRAEKVKDGWQIVGGVLTCVAASFVIFWVIRQYRTILFLDIIPDLKLLLLHPER
jgi:Cytochrome c oxidase subunit IV